MHHDDTPIGRVLTRREIVKLLGTSGIALATGAGLAASGSRRRLHALPSCIARPEQTEGPFFVDERLNRSDIRSDPASGVVSAGVPLTLSILVSKVSATGCEPLPEAQVDLWQCDAMGLYSGVTDRTFDTVGKKFLRGYQMTDAEGRATFRTIYPGWYSGRTVHLHFKVRVPTGSTRAAEFTSQLYFDDALTDRVHAAEPYSGKEGRRVRNEQDRIFRDGGARLLLAPRAVESGYQAEFSLGLELP